MKRALINGWNSFLKLFRFLVWYCVAVAAIFYLLPMVGLILEEQYEALSGTAKFIATLGFFSVVGAWQVMTRWGRIRGWPLGKSMG